MEAKARGPEIDSILALEDRGDFLDRVLDLSNPGQARVIEWSEMPQPYRMVLMLRGVWMDVSVSGLWKLFVENDVGRRWLADCVAWCRAIGATRAAECLAATAALFPGGRVPSDLDECVEAVQQIEAQRGDELPRGDPWKGIDPFHRLELEYDGAFDEMIDELRAYIAAHRDDPLGALHHAAADPAGTAAHEPTRPRAKPPVPRPVSEAQRRRMVRSFPEASVAPFLARLPRFTLDDWMAVVHRQLEQAEAIEKARTTLQAIVTDYEGGKIVPANQVKYRGMEFGIAVGDASRAPLAELPAVHELDGRLVPLRSLATTAVQRTAVGLFIRAELARNDAERTAAGLYAGLCDV